MNAIHCEDRTTHFGFEACAPSLRLPRHRHRHGYIAIVLEGGYLEAGDAGRIRVSAGHMLVHQRHEAHLNDFAPRGARVLNLPLPSGPVRRTVCSLIDPDAVVHLAERDLGEAACFAMLSARDGPEPETDWPDLLAAFLRTEKRFRLSDWARANGLAGSTVSRGFTRAYGVTPARYRVEFRVRRALDALTASRCQLAEIALESGFSDQSHMTREIVALTGKTPGAWRQWRAFPSGLDFVR